MATMVEFLDSVVPERAAYISRSTIFKDEVGLRPFFDGVSQVVPEKHTKVYICIYYFI